MWQGLVLILKRLRIIPEKLIPKYQNIVLNTKYQQPSAESLDRHKSLIPVCVLLACSTHVPVGIQQGCANPLTIRGDFFPGAAPPRPLYQWFFFSPWAPPNTTGGGHCAHGSLGALMVPHTAAARPDPPLGGAAHRRGGAVGPLWAQPGSTSIPDPEGYWWGPAGAGLPHHALRFDPDRFSANGSG